MKRAIVTPAALAPAALSELKDWLGITTTSDDAQLTALLRAALEACEDFTGIMPLQQDCEEVLPASSAWQVLRTRPVQAITGLEGIPAEGARFALPNANYAIELDADGGGRVLISNPGAAGRVAVRLTAGLAADWPSLPEALRHGVLRLAAFQYREREGDRASALPPAAVAALWRPWRRLRLA
ncbi:MAG TPA: phage head-tail connector protein [Novosphingobium sp.]|nr:phage head-tail connector protein [Novosphingobium sp.]HQA17291.1 phage head-tail connector protein [Novosphingobium sp.]